MTKEEAIQTLRANVMVACDTSEKVGYGTPLNKAIEQALEMAINALEQQSEDCVSRQAVTDAVENTIAKYIPTFIGQYERIPLELARAIKSVTPVTPTRKSGLRWIERFDNEDKWLECPHCHIDSAEAYNYCPNCGAEMRGTEND